MIKATEMLLEIAGQVAVTWLTSTKWVLEWEPVFWSIAVVLELVVASSPRGDDVLPPGRVETAELVLKDQIAPVVVEIAPQAIGSIGGNHVLRHVVHHVHQQHFDTEPLHRCGNVTEFNLFSISQVGTGDSCWAPTFIDRKSKYRLFHHCSTALKLLWNCSDWNAVP